MFFFPLTISPGLFQGIMGKKQATGKKAKKKNFYVKLLWVKILLTKLKVKVPQSCPTLCDPTDYTVHGILQARILEWVAFPLSSRSSQPRIEPRSPALQVDSLPAESKGNPTMLKWEAYPFASRSSQFRNWTRVSCIADRLFTNWAISEAQQNEKSGTNTYFWKYICNIYDKNVNNSNIKNFYNSMKVLW